MTFSEQSRLLLGNWEAYQDVRSAEVKLRAEVQQALMSLESRLQKGDVWNKAWHFRPGGGAQVYIWHDNWAEKREPLVWVGVEGATLERIFGDESPASAYIWVSKSQATSLVEGLRAHFNKIGTGGHGEPVAKGCYIVEQFLPKCLPEDFARFDTVFLDAAEVFLSHYAKQEPAITEAVREYLTKGAQQ